MSTNRQLLDLERQGTRMPKLGLIVAAFMLGLVVLILLDSWSRTKHFVSPIEILLGTAPVPSGEVVVVSQDGVTIYMPPNATDLEGTISMAVAQPGLSLIADETEWMLSKVVKVEFRGPDGAPVPDISFSQPLDVCFDLNEEQWQVYSQDPATYRVQYYAAQQNPPRWESLPQATHPDRFQVCGQTYHLSMFGLAIQAEPRIPVTGLGTAFAPVAGMPAAQEGEHRGRNNSKDGDASSVVPTNPPPLIANPGPTQVPPTQPPAAQPRPTDRPPAEPPAPADPQANGNGNGQGNGNGSGHGNGNGNDNGTGNGNGHGNGGGNGNGNGKGKD